MTVHERDAELAYHLRYLLTHETPTPDSIFELTAMQMRLSAIEGDVPAAQALLDAVTGPSAPQLADPRAPGAATPRLPDKPADERTLAEELQYTIDRHFWLGLLEDSEEEERQRLIATGTAYSTYILKRADTNEVFYVGSTQDPDKRLVQHLHNSRRLAPRTPVTVLIRELADAGIDIKMETVGEQLTFSQARAAETQLIGLFTKLGVQLVNVCHTRPPLTTAEKMRRWVAKPDGRARHLAGIALTDLRSGLAVSPRRVHWITQVGRVEDARAILRDQGREGLWPEEGAETP
jgi:hypothetical protein